MVSETNERWTDGALRLGRFLVGFSLLSAPVLPCIIAIVRLLCVTWKEWAFSSLVARTAPITATVRDGIKESKTNKKGLDRELSISIKRRVVPAVLSPRVFFLSPPLL